MQVIPVILGVTLIIFLLLKAVPGDPVTIMAGEHSLNPQSIANLRAELHLDEPLYKQYGYYLWGLLQGDLGFSYRYKRPVADIFKDFFPNSFRLALAAVFVEIILGIFAGIIAAVRKESFMDSFLTVLTTLLVCLPVFWLGMLLQSLLGVRLRWLPVSGIGNGSLRYYILPALTLAASSSAFVFRLMRSSLLEVLSQDYIRAAYAQGISRARVIYKHALRGALPPVVTLIGLDFGSIIGSAIATEVVFNWPGIGRQIYLAILARDRQLVLNSTLLLVLIFVFLNLLVDLAYAFLDPRVREEQSGV